MIQTIKPLVTVCIPSYNHARFVGESIQGILDQTYPNIELIIIDDGSSDNSVEIIQSYVEACQRRFVRFEFRSQRNKGLSTTLNIALEWAEGDYFSPIASDDVALPHKISVLIAHLDSHPSHHAATGCVREIDEAGNVLKTHSLTSETYKEWSFEKIIMGRAMLSAPASAFRTESLIAMGGYNPKTILEDWDMWLRFSSQRKRSIATLPMVVTSYRQHTGNTHKKLYIMQKERIKILFLYRNRFMAYFAIIKFSLAFVRDYLKIFFKNISALCSQF